MKRIAIVLICTLAAFGAISTWAQTQPTQPMSNTNPSTVTGRVVSSSSTSLVIVADSGTQMTFAVDATSQPDVFEPNDRVTVKYSTLTAGDYRAASVMSASAATTDNVQYGTTAKPATTMPSTTNDPNNMNSTDSNDMNATRSSLPRTAGEMPLIALTGLLALGAAAGLRATRRQS